MSTEKPKHTPGPWRWVAHGQTISIDAPDCAGIAHINPLGYHDKGIPALRDKVHADLMTAAPNLLIALRDTQALLDRLVTRFSEDDEIGAQFHRNSAAIAKAEGREPD